jgi:uncharacterized membrane protein YcaP (DUF421 family)
MTELIRDIFGEGDRLNGFQMSCRGIVMGLVGLCTIRIAGRRTFGMKSAFDNVIAILLGSILGRAVVGASPFLPVVAASLTIAVAHRIAAWYSVQNHGFGKLIKGSAVILYEKGHMNERALLRHQITKEDIMESLRQHNVTDLNRADAIYLERSGRISVIKQKE